MRLEWLHATAARDRWWEEHKLLFEEMRRVGATFRYEQARWEQMAVWGEEPASAALKLGVRAHALKKAAMYERLAVQAEAKFKEVQWGSIVTPVRRNAQG